MAKDPTSTTPRKSSRKRQSTVADIDDDSPTKRLSRVTATMDLSKTLDSDMPAEGLQNGHASPRIYHSVPLRSSANDETPRDRSTDTLAGEVAIVEPGLSVLGQHVTKLVELITALRDNGVERLALDLPQIVVVGDQSTGKSSLIEGLSGIKVPRNEGTCTRCPIEINLKPVTEGTWHCNITIVKKYGWKMSKSKSDSSLGLGPYDVELPTAILEPFVEVTKKDEIPLWLQRAQLAVLNPGQPYQKFAVPLNENIDYSGSEESFSPNVIRMDIYAMNLPSLSFFDLPGVIVQDSELHVPKMIRKLVRGYIKSSKSLILLTLPIDCDRANSQAAGLVSEAKAEGRTIGIISKPDRLVTANIPQWKEILSGKKFKYQLGYRVVKNPADPRVGWEDARLQEREFFRQDYNFRVHLQDFQQQFGTERLQAFLSKHLLTMIKDSLPEIREKVANRFKIIDKELSTLPKPMTGNVVFQIQQRIHNFEALLTAVITNSLDLEHDSSEALTRTKAAVWFQRWHRRAQVFYEQLIQSAPQLEFRASHSSGSESIQGSKAQETIVVDSDDESTNARPVQRKHDGTPQISTAPAFQSTLSDRDIKKIRDYISKATKKFTLSDLQSCVHRYNNGVTGISDPRVFEFLVKESTRGWLRCATQFLDETGQACQKIVSELLLVIFADLKNTKLFGYMERSARALLGALHDSQAGFSTLILNLEDKSPLTLNHEEQETAKHAILAELVQQMQNFKIKRQLDRLTEFQGRSTTAADEKRITEQVRHDPNQNHQELIELAGAIAYYRIAARRQADYMALSMRNRYFYGLTTDMKAKICGDLGISLDGDSDLNRTNKRLIELMAPPEAQYLRHCQLERELEVLTRTTKNVSDVLRDEDDKHDNPVILKREVGMRQQENDYEMEE